MAFSLIQNHVFLDGNTRVGHAAMETFLMLDGYQIAAHVDEQEGIVLAVASGLCSRAELTDCCGASACSLAAGEHTAPGPDLAAQTDRSVHSPINGSTPPGQLAHPASRAVRDDIGWGTLQWTIYAPGTHGRCRTPDFGATPRVVAAHAD